MDIQDWGKIDYREAVEKQLALVEQVIAQPQSETIVFCSHPPVVTLGRGTQAGDVTSWQGQTVETSRGGRATYHGPNQLVIYPVLNLLNSDRQNFAIKDIHAYLRQLEQAIVFTLKEFQVTAEAKTTKAIGEDGRELSFTGVWVGERKIASIGIAVRRWVTYHGVAINLDHDPKAFRGINPCGFSVDVVTSLEEILGEAVSREKFQEVAVKTFKTFLN